jgi:CoA:oxalate CoA-transferase
MSRSLNGVRVIDLSHVLAMPTCTMILGDLGAEVIKIEPFWGDDSRDFGPWIDKHGKNRSGYFISLNRNKKSIALDLKTDKGKEILRDLIKVSDVITENFRPTTMRKLGFGWEEIHDINPKIIYASICGFGHDSIEEYAARPAYDMVAQAYSGIMSLTGPLGGPPCRIGTSSGDITAGHLCAMGILAALYYRHKTGKGQYVDVAMVDGLFSMLIDAFNYYTVEGTITEAQGTMHPQITPSQAFKTKDDWVIIAAQNDSLWSKYCKVMNREDLINKSIFKTNSLRTKNRKELLAILEPLMAKKTTKEWIDLFKKEDFPAFPINDIGAMVESPEIRYRKMIREVSQPGLKNIKISGTPFNLSETPGDVYAPAPRLGEHSESLLRSILAYSQEEIDKLKAEKVVVPDLEL